MEKFRALKNHLGRLDHDFEGRGAHARSETQGGGIGDKDCHDASASDDGIVSADASTPPHWLTFAHEAMATEFTIAIAGQPAEYARQAAGAAWRELDRLESELSRYVESSDIARANRLLPGEVIVIGEDAMRCLLIAAEISETTGRAFDPAYASVRAADQDANAPLFALDPAAHTLRSLTERLHLDLGAVGKGYALDVLGDVLDDWGVAQACLQSGGSTALALGPPDGASGWPVGLGGHTVPLKVARSAARASP
jgi:thiamine biosynthesis lipoprotein ApbE